MIRSQVESIAEQMADHIAEQIEIASKILQCDVTVLGPAAAPVEKLRGKFRYHMLLSSNVAQSLQNVVRRAQTTTKSIDDVQWIIDIDPQDML